MLVWLINYHHFLVLHWVDDSPFPDLASSTFNLAKCTYYFKIAGATPAPTFFYRHVSITNVACFISVTRPLGQVCP